MGKPTFEGILLSMQPDTEAFHGRMAKSSGVLAPGCRLGSEIRCQGDDSVVPRRCFPDGSTAPIRFVSLVDNSRFSLLLARE